MPKDVYLQPEAADPILPSELVLSLARQFVPTAQVVTGVDESGGEARTYAIDGDLILKVQRPHRLRPRTSLEKEVLFLNQLANDQRIRVPKVLGYGRAEPGIEYTLMTRLPGQAFRHLNLAGATREKAFHALGQTIRLIHGLDQAAFIESKLFPGDRTFEEFKTRLEELFNDTLALINRRVATGELDWNLAVSPRQIIQETLARLPQSDERVVLHSNPGPEHTFIDSASNTFSGLIDFGDAYISHPVLDLRRWPFPQDRAILLEGYVSLGAVSENFMTTWQVVMILTNLTILASSADPALREAVREDLVAKLAGK